MRIIYEVVCVCVFFSLSVFVSYPSLVLRMTDVSLFRCVSDQLKPVSHSNLRQCVEESRCGIHLLVSLYFDNNNNSDVFLFNFFSTECEPNIRFGGRATHFAVLMR